jgi:CSLREA domain-containing protein
MSLSSERRKSRVRRERRRTWLHVEALEGRCLPATITVTSLADNLTPDGLVTLREALQAANTNTSVDGSVAGSVGADTIQFQPGLTGTINLSGGQLTISEALTVQGLGSANTTIDAHQNSRIFDIANAAGDVTLNGLTLTNGRSGTGQEGGAIRSLGTRTLSLGDCRISNNSAGGFGGGIGGRSTTVTLTNSTLSNNSAGGAGGGIDVGTVTLTNSTVTGNSSQQFGGGMEAGTVTLTNCTVSGNSAVLHGGGIVMVSLTLTNSTVSGNTAGTSGGGIQGATVTATNSTISANAAGTNGGGIFSGSPTLTNCTVTGNTAAGNGGGLDIVNTLTLRGSIVAGNRDTGDGSHPDLRPGTGTLTVSNSLVGNNNGTSLTATGATPDASGNLIGSAASPLDPLLGPLADNGGPTQTHALLTGSPAIDRGANPGNLTTDQRGSGFRRFSGLAADVGAFEVQSSGPLALVVTTEVDELDAGFDANDLGLREALAAANNNPGADTITFAGLLSGKAVRLTLGQLQITDPVTIQGLGAINTTIDAQQNSRILDITAFNGDVTLDGLTLSNGRTVADNQTNVFINSGGAVHFEANGTLTIRHCVLSGNSTAGKIAGGGAIFTLAGPVVVVDSTLSGNHTEKDAARGGAIYSASGPVTLTNSTLSGNFTQGVNANGGGLFSAYGSVTLGNSTVSGNLTHGRYARGGGLFVRGHTDNSSTTLTITNSTISNNGTLGDKSSGGGVYARNNTPITLTNSTLTDNGVAGGQGATGGGIYADTGAVTIRSSIVAANADASGGAPDLHPGTGALAITNSLLGSNAGTSLAETGPTPNADGNLIGGVGATVIPPLLGPLADHGGPTQTHALLPNSPARNRGSNPLGLTTDQRGAGFPRQLGPAVDMGAFEATEVTPPPAVVDPPTPLESPPAHIVFPRPISVSLTVRRRRLIPHYFAKIQFTDGSVRELASPLKWPLYRTTAVSLRDLDGNGIYDAVEFTGRILRRTVKRTVRF